MRDRSQIGELRPSQLMHTYGVGATVELPELTTLVLGLDDWPRALGKPVSEPRLLAAVRAAVGSQVEQLLTPPVVPEDEPTPPTEETGGPDGAAPPAGGVEPAIDVVVTSPLPDRSDDETWCRLGTKRAAMSTPARKPLTIPKKAPPPRPVALTGKAGRTAPGLASTCSRWSTGACAGCRHPGTCRAPK